MPALLSPQLIEALVQDLKNGNSVKALGEKYGVTYHTVYYYAAKNGIPLTKSARKRAARGPVYHALRSIDPPNAIHALIESGQAAISDLMNPILLNGALPEAHGYLYALLSRWYRIPEAPEDDDSEAIDAATKRPLVADVAKSSDQIAFEMVPEGDVPPEQDEEEVKEAPIEPTPEDKVQIIKANQKMSTKNIPDETLQKVIQELSEDGSSVTELSKRHEIPASTLYYIISRHGIMRSGGKKQSKPTIEVMQSKPASVSLEEMLALTDAQEMMALDALRNGVLSVKVIAEALSVPQRVIFAVGMSL